jgi:hypothetical protein
MSGDPTAFTKPARVDPRKLLPPATLYVHVSQDSFTRDPETGVARFEGVGPVTVTQARQFLGTHCQVTIRPVLDIAGQVPVDAYETPQLMAEALHLRNPGDIFPYAVNLGRGKDKDHTIPYVPPDNGGPPGQTHLGNLGPMVRFHHRIRTHGRWTLKQPEPGTYLWRTPHGWVYLVDHHGTHHLGNTTTAQTFFNQAPRASDGGSGRGKRANTVEVIPAHDILEYAPTHQRA